MTNVAIDVEDVVKTYDGGRIRALDGISFAVRRGEFIAVAGPSGSGKSTLLHLIAGLDVPDSGRILVEGHDLTGEIDRDRYRGEFVGLVFQLDNLLPMLTAAENIEIPMVGTGVALEQRRERARELLRDLGLRHVAKQRPSALSGGERQRVAMARAIANSPPVLLLDEPTGRLDSASEKKVLDLVRKLRNSHGVTVLLVTHDEAVAATADRQMAMTDGRLVEAATRCIKCRQTASAGAQFCQKCGQPLSARQ